MRTAVRPAGGWPFSGFVGKILAALLLACSGLLPAEADAETHSLRLQFWGTRDVEEIVFKRDGTYDAEGLHKLNRFLRDRSSDDMAGMDPRLFDVLWEVYRRSGSRYPIVIVSGYRNRSSGLLRLREPTFCPSPIMDGADTPLSPLARRMASDLQTCRSKVRAMKTHHALGRAVDFFMVDVDTKRIEQILRGIGVGRVFSYSGANAPLVHFGIPDEFADSGP